MQTPHVWVATWVARIALVMMTIPNASLVNVQKIDYHNVKFVQLPDSRSWDYTWSTKGPSHLQTKIGS